MIKLSVIVVSYNMQRELPRTIRSLSPSLQRDIDACDYEIIVVDNGSSMPVSESLLRTWGANVRCVSVPNPTKSPVAAVNLGLSLAEGEVCGVFIDGARMATPGVLSEALYILQGDKRAIISTIGFHLGPEHQSLSAGKGYNQAFEDFLLASIAWELDPYRLFNIACFAGSSPRGWFGPALESNALFMSSSLWHELGGYEARFQLAGGGLSNLDVFRRAVELVPNGLVTLLGEGTFHQYHGGEASNSSESKWELFHQEYQQIRGCEWSPPLIKPRFSGTVHPYCMRFIEASAALLKF